MMRQRASSGSRLLVVLLLIAPALSLAGNAGPADAQTPRRGGVLRVADREAPNLDPHLSISFLTHSWANMVYSQLVRYAHGPEQRHPADFSIVPDLAERWEQPSPTTLVFTLRKGVRFHNRPPVNGREVTAEDAKYSLVHDIQRYLADKAYYVYLPTPPQYITHAPSVKGFKHHDGFSLGYRVMFTWLER